MVCVTLRTAVYPETVKHSVTAVLADSGSGNVVRMPACSCLNGLMTACERIYSLAPTHTVRLVVKSNALFICRCIAQVKIKFWLLR